MKKISQDKSVIFFDGVCNLCHGFVQFVIKRDKYDYFRYSALTSEYRKSLLSLDFVKDESMILIDNNKIYKKSDALFKIFQHLPGPISFLYYFIYLPKFIRNYFYTIIANNRYNILGKNDECWLMTDKLKIKFLD